MAKKDKKVWVLVETVSMFRHRYVVEAPADHPEYAMDTVVCDEAKEFSQEWMGENIVSHRVVKTDEALRICDEDNEYLKEWDDERKIEQLFTRVSDD
jgi:hypothetical protein